MIVACASPNPGYARQGLGSSWGLGHDARPMLARLRLRCRLNHGVAYAVVAALLLAGLPNLVVHAHADTDNGHHAALEQPRHVGDDGSEMPSGALHMHDFGVLGQTPVLPPAMLSEAVGAVQSVVAETAAGIVVNPFTSNPFRPPAA